MKKTLFLWILLTCTAAWVAAQDATSLQVAPSDQVKYPDASEILNKSEPAPAHPLAPTAPAAEPIKTTLPTAKPLVTTIPVPAAPAPQVATPVSASTLAEHGWYLKWTLTGDEDGALGWVQGLGLPASLHPLSAGQWEVWAGPLDSAALKNALKGQGGVATLVKK